MLKAIHLSDIARLNFRRCLIITLFFFSFSLSAHAQQRYVVFFKDKADSPYRLDAPEEFLSERAIQRRQQQGIPIVERDLPVNPHYLDSLRLAGAEVLYATKWLNGALIKAKESQLKDLQKSGFLVGRSFDLGILEPSALANEVPAAERAPTTGVPEVFGRSANQLNMLGVDKMHLDGFMGEGITIAILDGGFYKANEFSAFDSLFKSGRLLDTYDFVAGEESVFEDSRHGMQVLATMAAYSPGELVGPAWKASYLLYRTEDTGSESRLEEFNWLVAAERADSAGVDIINSSLGYTTFDDQRDDYTTERLDGESAFITVAADLAAAAGILVVASAGNEGNDPWGYIAPPADADSVLSVGAVDAEGMVAWFSSRGPTSDGRIKPNVAAQGRGTVLLGSTGRVSTSNGTSFAAPLIAGLAAGMWQAFPELTNMQLLRLIERSASQHDTPDSLLGYGVPHFERAAAIMNGLGDQETDEAPLVFPNPAEGDRFYVAVPAEMLGEKIKVVVHDQLGKILYSSTQKADRLTFSFDSQGLAPGIYFLEISAGKQVSKQKLLVK